MSAAEKGPGEKKEPAEMWVCGHTRKCRWLGLHSELKYVPTADGIPGSETGTCPRCGDDEFFVRPMTDAEFAERKKATAEELWWGDMDFEQKRLAVSLRVLMADTWHRLEGSIKILKHVNNGTPWALTSQSSGGVSALVGTKGGALLDDPLEALWVAALRNAGVVVHLQKKPGGEA